ncbi:MAG: SAM-dependent methyltransferase [Clostridia bacterium]|nr:SAM-dependent methyltransferase [Clostridia bacterium]
MEKDFKTYLNEIFADNIKKIVISNLSNKDCKYKKIDVKQTENVFFVSKYTQTQVFNENLNEDELKEFLYNAQCDFKQFNFFSESTEYCLKLSKKNKLFFNKLKNKSSLSQQASNNRKKNYILNEFDDIPPLVDIGVFTKEGKIVASMQNKFKQINRFLEIIDDNIKDKNLSEINIIDFGCGKSYLTFIIYYYFKFIKNINPHIIGLDLKEDVIKHCNQTAQKYGYDGLKFEVGNINGYNPPFTPDMVVTLHACDTATDFALANAVNWGAKMIFSVPCCQHELNNQIKTDNFSIITRYGIVKERIAALYTDIMRCNLLASVGYKVDLMEFVDLAHSPKNLLIRASKANIAVSVKKERLQEVEHLKTEFNLQPTLYKLLKNRLSQIEK